MGDVRRVGLMSVHTSPLARPGAGDAGGLNVYVEALARRMAARGVAVDVFTRAHGPDLPPTLEVAEHLRVHHLAAGPPTTGKTQLTSHLCAFYLAFAGHPATAEVDVLHAHYWMSGWVGQRAQRRLGLPLVQTFHTLASAKNASLAPGDRPEPPLRLAAEARIMRSANAVIASSPEELRTLRRLGARSAQLVEPGIDLEVMVPGDASATRAALGGGRLLLFVGRLQPLKGPDTAVRILAALRDMLPDDGIPTRLLIVGGPSGNGVGTTDGPALLELAADLGVGGDVALLGPRSHGDLAELYRAADVVVVPSHSESFGLVALEAQACGTPVVATDVGGLRHVLGDIEGARGGGTLVRDHDPAAFAAAAVPYLLDRGVRRRTGAAGVARASLFTWDRTVDGTLAVYASLAGAAAATGA